MSDEIERNKELRRLIDLRREAEDLDRRAKDAKRARDEQMVLVHEMLQRHGTRGSTTVELGEGYGTFRFVPGETIRSKVYDEEAFREWVTAEQREVEFFFPDKLRQKPINDLVREVREHSDAQFPPGVSDVEVRKVTVTQVKS